MNLHSRKILDNSFTGFSLFAVFIMVLSLVFLLGPIIVNGIDAYIFKATVEHEKVLYQLFNRGSESELVKVTAETGKAREKLYAVMGSFEKELNEMVDSNPERGYALDADYAEFKNEITKLLGPMPGKEKKAVLPRDKFGATRWDKSLEILSNATHVKEWDYSSGIGVLREKPRKDLYVGTKLERAFESYLTVDYMKKMQHPGWTFYYGFLTDTSVDAHFFGGVWPEVLGTLYLTFGAMLLAIPAGIIAAIYLVEYAGDTKLISFIRSCIGTLAGVPSVVFGLFGLACFLSEGSIFRISDTPSVAAGCATLALLVLPTIIRATEEAIRSVPHSYREGSIGLGATKWECISKVILPSALPGILTGIVISMGRAAGETAPIIFTAAVSVGKPLGLGSIFSQPTPALPWNIYNLCTEHQEVDQIRYVQYGMVFTLVAIVLVLNLSAIYLRARVSKNLKG